MKTLDQAIEKLEKWLSQEDELLTDIAHEVARQSDLQEMIDAKREYELQEAKVVAIYDAIELLKK